MARTIAMAAAALICFGSMLMAQEDYDTWYCYASDRSTRPYYSNEFFKIPGTLNFSSTLPEAVSGEMSRRYLKVIDIFQDAFVESLGTTKEKGINNAMDKKGCHAFPEGESGEKKEKIRMGINGRESRGYRIHYTNWKPNEEQYQDVLRASAPRREEAPADLFSPKARDATKTWIERNGISPTGNADSTLALMVQTALALQNFDPGPRDGKIGRKTLAAIAAWQAIVGLLAGADLGDVLSAILHTAMTLQGLDPGPVDRMFGQNVLKTVAAWQTAHGPALEEAQKAQPSYGEESDDRLLSSSWRRVPDALSCVSIDYSERRLTQFIVNHCNHPVRVEWCYVGKTGEHGQWQCDPGPPGLGFMDRVGHRATRKGVSVPDYYTSGAGLKPKPSGDRVQGHDHRPMPAVGRVRYIACGYDHIIGVRHYDMEWDAHTGQFRCLAYFVPDGPDVQPEAGVQ